MYFQTTYYRPVAGGKIELCHLPRGQIGPPIPHLPTQQMTEFLISHQSQDCQTFPEMYLKNSAATSSNCR